MFKYGDTVIVTKPGFYEGIMGTIVQEIHHKEYLDGAETLQDVTSYEVLFRHGQTQLFFEKYLAN